MKSKTDTIPELSILPWTEILELSKSDRLGEKFNSIPAETLLFEQAIKVADIMREFALRVLAERNVN